MSAFIDKLLEVAGGLVGVRETAPNRGPEVDQMHADEIEKLKAFVEQLTAPIIVEAPPTGA